MCHSFTWRFFIAGHYRDGLTSPLCFSATVRER
jgi:hypothetical protein